MTVDPNLALVLDYLACGVDGRAPVSDQTGEDLTVRTVEEEHRIAEAERKLADQEGRRRTGKSSVRYGNEDRG